MKIMEKAIELLFLGISLIIGSSLAEYAIYNIHSTFLEVLVIISFFWLVAECMKKSFFIFQFLFKKKK